MEDKYPSVNQSFLYTSNVPGIKLFDHKNNINFQGAKIGMIFSGYQIENAKSTKYFLNKSSCLTDKRSYNLLEIT